VHRSSLPEEPPKIVLEVALRGVGGVAVVEGWDSAGWLLGGRLPFCGWLAGPTRQKATQIECADYPRKHKPSSFLG
jgi:hypothetical protein